MFNIEAVTKTFKDKTILKDISFKINQGDKIALLGNNGAGKSTLLKIISGEYKADSGQVSTQLDYQTEIGMMPQEDVLIDELTVNDIVKLKCHMNQFSVTSRDTLLDKVSLQAFKNHNVGKLSGGQKRRLSLLLTLLNSPSLIFLDEPTTGMDLSAIDDFWHLLEYENFSSVIVTHDFNQIDRFFTKVLILKNGELKSEAFVKDIHETGQTIETYYREQIKRED